MVGWNSDFCRPGVAVIEIVGDIDIYGREPLRHRLDAIAEANVVVVDLTKLAHFDLTLVNGLIRLKNRLSARNDENAVRLVGATEHLRKVLHIANLLEAFEFYESNQLAQKRPLGSCSCPI